MSRCRLRPVALLGLFSLGVSASPQMVSGGSMKNFDATFGLEKKPADLEVKPLTCSLGPNILHPGERATLTYWIENRGDTPLQGTFKVHVIPYGTRIPAGDIWTPSVRKLSGATEGQVRINVPAKGGAEIKIDPNVPARFGGYGIVFDFGSKGRLFGGSVARVVAPKPGAVWLPAYALDMPWPHEMAETVVQTFSRLGVKGCRMGLSYTPTTAGDFESSLRDIDRDLNWCKKNGVTVMLTLGAGSAPQPLGRGRPWLKDDGTLIEGVKEDLAWLPSYDADFRKFVQVVCEKYGWPKGPVNAVELWNEPWEGVSISGWGADSLRYREIYRAMADGVLDARKSGVKVLIGGASSSSNTLDKLFCDGTLDFLSVVDFVSIHYQELSASPALVPMWVNRKGEYGHTQVWDTESWVANAEERIPAVVASMRAQGQERAMGTYGGNVYDPKHTQVNGRDYRPVWAWTPAAAVAAAARYVGERPFEGLVLKGLPWVFRFGGPDGTLVVSGDLGGVYNRNRTLFRDPQSKLKNGKLVLPAGTKARVLDACGNPLPLVNGRIEVPLDGNGVYLRPIGSMESLVQAVRRARVTGYPPVEIVAHDAIRPDQARLTVTNILNRPVSGVVSGTFENVTFRLPRVKLAPGEQRTLNVSLRGLKRRDDNLYALRARFSAGTDGVSETTETMRLNLIAPLSPQIDGDLKDWIGVLPQTLTGEGIRATMTEEAYLPFIERKESGNRSLATGYLAASADGFYFAARIADPTPSEGTVRFANRDDDSYFYPAVSYEGTERKERNWPEGVRRFSYRRDPDLPAGNGTDNVQIAFNVLPNSKKPWLMAPPKTMPKWMIYPDTDYEYALNTVAPQYGGGTEVFRLLAPGLPRKHFYPRQPSAPQDGGSVGSAKLVTKRDGGVRIVEAFLPWSEIPDVHRAYLAKRPIKFSFRVNDNDGPAYELAQGRSVSKDNSYAFHNDWTGHWANEVEFGWQR